MRWMGALPLLLPLVACARPAPPPPERVQLQVSVGGAAVWPPSGAGCTELVACCDAMTAVEPSVNLFCQLAAARGGSCAEMKTMATSYFIETKHTPLSVCQ